MADYIKEEDVVSCRRCRCLVFKNDSNRVKCNCGDEFYCNKCRPEYDRYWISYMSSEVSYYKEMVVDKEGEPVGYVKIKEKKNGKITHTTGEK